MSDLVFNSSTTAVNPYTALNQNTGSNGLYGPTASPRYYDYYSIDLSEGFFKFSKPIRAVDKSAQSTKYSPFNPDEMYSLVDGNGNPLNHKFIAVRGMPVFYGVGGALSSYKQLLPGEVSYGGHCTTVKAEFHQSSEPIIVNGDLPLQSSKGVTYNFAAYQSKDDSKAGKPRQYALGEQVKLYGKCTPQFAQAVGRPELMSCADCVAAGLDVFTYQMPDAAEAVTNRCKTKGSLAFYITELAYKTKEVNWIKVADLGIPELGEGFIAVLPLRSLELRAKPDQYELNKGTGLHVPPNAQKPHDWELGTYKNAKPGTHIWTEVPNVGWMNLIAIPTDMWACKVNTGTPATSGTTALMSNTPGTDNMPIADRHTFLQTALKAYLAPKNTSASSNDDEALDFYSLEDLKTAEPEPIEASKLPSLADLQAQAGDFFSSLKRPA